MCLPADARDDLDLTLGRARDEPGDHRLDMGVRLGPDRLGMVAANIVAHRVGLEKRIVNHLGEGFLEAPLVMAVHRFPCVDPAKAVEDFVQWHSPRIERQNKT